MSSRFQKNVLRAFITAEVSAVKQPETLHKFDEDKILPKLSDLSRSRRNKTHAGNAVKRIHAVRHVHREGERHRMPRRQGCLTSMSENAIACR